MTEIQFFCNGTFYSLPLNPAKPLLDVLREDLTLTGTKEGCREGDCGACTVLMGALQGDAVSYSAVNSCLLPAGEIQGKHIVTVEGLASETLTPVQHHFVEEGGTQCGFCTPGFVMSLTGYFLNTDAPTPEGGIEALDGNICRCTGYAGIKRAVHAAESDFTSAAGMNGSRLEKLIASGFVPAYFAEMHKKLSSIKNNNPVNAPETAVAVGGGTDLYVQKWDELQDTGVSLFSSRGINREIIEQGGEIIIGAGATVSQLIESDILHAYFPVLREKLPLFGSLPIRNRATVAGNIVNASPIADTVNIFLALDAKVHVKNRKGTARVIELKSLYTGYKTLAMNKDEIITGLLLPVPEGEYHFNYEKVSRRTYLDIATVNSSAYISLSDGLIDEARLSLGGVAPVPKYLTATCAFLRGKAVCADTMHGALAAMEKEIAPISDARGSAEYKKLLAGQLLKAHFLTLFPAVIREEDVQ